MVVAAGMFPWISTSEASAAGKTRAMPPPSILETPEPNNSATKTLPLARWPPTGFGGETRRRRLREGDADAEPCEGMTRKREEGVGAQGTLPDTCDPAVARHPEGPVEVHGEVNGKRAFLAFPGRQVAWQQAHSWWSPRTGPSGTTRSWQAAVASGGTGGAPAGLALLMPRAETMPEPIMSNAATNTTRWKAA